MGHSVGHPSFSGTLSGTLPRTLRARRARKTPVAGRGVRKKNGMLAFLKRQRFDTRAFLFLKRAVSPIEGFLIRG